MSLVSASRLRHFLIGAGADAAVAAFITATADGSHLILSTDTSPALIESGSPRRESPTDALAQNHHPVVQESDLGPERGYEKPPPGAQRGRRGRVTAACSFELKL